MDTVGEYLDSMACIDDYHVFACAKIQNRQHGLLQLAVVLACSYKHPAELLKITAVWFVCGQCF